jgi:hypothetical protein
LLVVSIFSFSSVTPGEVLSLFSGALSFFTCYCLAEALPELGSRRLVGRIPCIICRVIDMMSIHGASFTLKGGLQVLQRAEPSGRVRDRLCREASCRCSFVGRVHFSTTLSGGGLLLVASVMM